MRREDFEDIIREAITAKVRLILRYENGTNDRTFEPSALYFSTKDRSQVSVNGVQVRDAAKPSSPASLRVFDVGKISRLTLTATKFKPDPRFNRLDRMYANGIICYAQT